MSIFEKFDAQMNIEEIEKQKKEAAENAQQYEEVPAGTYVAKIEKMELGTTKDGRPIFKVQMRLEYGQSAKENEFLSKFKKNKPCIFMNRVIFGTKNDGNMIASVEGWLNKIFPDEPVVFTSYSQFADEILDCAEGVQDLHFDVDYDPDVFNSITINNVF